MDYHLHQQDRTVGVFPLEELRRRRQAGELTGKELVWCQGMPQWQTLDAVLKGEVPAGTPPILATPTKKRTSSLVYVGIAACVLVVVVWVGLAARLFIRGFRRGFEHAVSETTGIHYGSAYEAASKPIQWTTNTMTTAMLAPAKREFRIRQYVDAYQKYSAHNPVYDTEAVRLLNTWVDTNYDGPLKTNRDALVEMCDQLATNPACDDPLVLTVTETYEGELHESVRRLDLALKGFEHSEYKAYPRLFATVELANRLAQFRHNDNRIRELDFSAKKLLKQALSDGSLGPEDQAEFGEILVEGWGSGFTARNSTAVIQILRDAGKDFQWLALLVEGDHEINLAWEARGSGYANTVTPEGWKGFNEHLAKARALLTKAWELRPDLALAPMRMIRVSLGASDITEMRLWFDRTTMAQLDCAPAWQNLRWGLRPRWYGSLDAMLAFGIAALNTHRFDTDVPRMFFDTVENLEEELKVSEHIYAREDIWPHLSEMYEGYIAAPSRAKEQNGWRSVYAYIAFMAGKYDVARQQLEHLNWQPTDNNRTQWGRDMSLMPYEVAARTGPLADQIKRVENQRANGETTRALNFYTEMETATNADELTKVFVHDRVVTLQQEKKLKDGEWVDYLPTTTNAVGWAAPIGKYLPVNTGGVDVSSGQSGHLLYSRTRVGPDFEVHGSFEVIQTSSTSFQGGIVMGMPQFGFLGWYGFRMKRNTTEGDVVQFAQGWSTQQLSKHISLNSNTNSFTLRVKDCKVNATVNGQVVFENQPLPRNYYVPEKDYYIGLGAFNDMNDTVIRYRDVQVRKL